MFRALNLEIKDLRLVRAVVEEGTLSAAAKCLGLSQPALSRRLADAERRLETVLFVRQGRRLHLAPAGMRVLALGQTMLPGVEQAEQEIRQSGTEADEADVRLTATSPHAYLWLLPALRKYADKYGHSPFRMEFSEQPDPFEMLRTDRAELVISPGPGIQPDLKAISLFREEVFAYLSPKHPAARQTFFPLADLASVDLIIDAPLEQQPILARLLRIQGIKPKRVVCVPLTEAVLELAAGGHGVACLSRPATLRGSRRSLLAELRVTPRGLFAPWRAFCLKSRAGTLAPKAQELAAVCGT